MNLTPLRVAIEPVERRLLLASGDLDPTFHEDGRVVGPAVQDSTLLLQPDGKILSGGGNVLLRYNADGTPDTSFGGRDGRVDTPFFIRDLALQNGNIVASGSSGDLFAVTRFLPNGDLDASFGDGGVRVVAFGGFEETGSAAALTVDSSNRIVAVGAAQIDASQPNPNDEYWEDRDRVIVRLTPGGNLDTSFSEDGKVLSAPGGWGDHHIDVGIQPVTNKIVTAGITSDTTNNYFNLGRWNDDGSFDSTFVSDINQGSYDPNQVIHDMDFLSNGEIVVALGVYDYGAVVVKTDVNGKRIGGYQNAFFTHGYDYGEDDAYALAVDSGNRVYVGGRSGGDAVVARLTSDLDPDRSFYQPGGHRIDFGARDGVGHLALQPDGKILFSGTTGTPGQPSSLMLGRLVTDGAPRQTPFVGSGFTTDQTIQFEDFDNGGEGIAFHDNEATNRGGVAYREGGVDVGGGGTGRVVANAEQGEWLEYTLTVPEAGHYRVEASVANPAAGGSMRVWIDGFVEADLSVPQTASFNTYAAASSPFFRLEPGTYTLRLSMESAASNGAVGNLDSFRVARAAETQPPTTPANPREISRNERGVVIKFDASTDDSGIDRYEVTVTPDDGSAPYTDIVRQLDPSYFLESPEAGVDYTVSIVAVDFAENRSAPASITVPGGVDTQKPSPASNVRLVNATERSIEFAWDAATDDVRVASYSIYSDGTWLGAVNADEPLRFIDHGWRFDGNRLEPGTAYNYVVRASDTSGNSSEVTATFSTTSAPTQTPFTGSPGTPGNVIQVEHFDNGGEGVAYHDNDTVNRGTSSLRSGTGVDVYNRSFGASVGYVQAGEWLEYTINVPTAGNYDLGFRVANPAAGARVSFQLDGQPLTGLLTVPNTGSWNTYSTVTAGPVSLPAGTHVLRLSFNTAASNGSVGDFDWVRFSAVNTPQPDTQAPTAPSNLRVIGTTATTIEFEWTAATDNVSVTTLDVYRDGVLLGQIEGNRTRYTLQNLQPSTTYTFGVRARDGSGNISPTSTIQGTTAASTGGQSPFKGSPFAPGDFIQAEDFDNGGEGVAFHDNDATNRGTSGYRSGVGVDLYSRSFGTTVGYVQPGEWLEYTIDVPTAGSYDLSFRVANPASGARVHFELDGTDVSGPINVPNTGNWSNYVTVTKSGVNLPAGTHVLRLAFDAAASNGSVGDYDYVRFASAGTPTGDTQAPTTPGNFRVSERTNTTITVEWDASTDNLGVTAYELFRNGNFLSRGLQRSFRDANLTPDTTYQYSVVAIDAAGNRSAPAQLTSSTLSNPTGQSPFRGTPFNPGEKIQFEDFDNGGEGIAYHDADTSNIGGKYRSTGVDIQSTTDDGGGHFVGWAYGGEWLEFTVNVPAAGAYSISTRSGTTKNGVTIQYDVAGENRTGPIAVPNTGSFNTFTTWDSPVFQLPAGETVVRMVVHNNGAYSGGAANFNWFRLNPLDTPTNPNPEQSPFRGTAFTADQIIAVEDFDNGGEGIAYHDNDPQNRGGAYRINVGVDLYPSGNNFNIGYAQPGEWTEYTIFVAESGTYALDTRVAHPENGAQFHLEIDGADVTGPVNVPNSGSWNTYLVVSRNVQLTQGFHTLRLSLDTAAPNGSVGNYDWLMFRKQ